jgi:hypothetical protein
MPKYKKKPVIIEAELWFHIGDHPEVKEKFEPDTSGICMHCNRSYKLHGWITTLEGGHIVCPGDYIIKGIKGEFYPCKPDIFKETYDLVEEG